jgi:hypothetical protein
MGIPIEVVTVVKEEWGPSKQCEEGYSGPTSRWRLRFGAVLRDNARRGGSELGEDDGGRTDHRRRIRLQSSEAQVAVLKDETHNT